MVTWVLSREGVDARTSGRIYLVVVQSVMLYGLETWVMKSCVGRVLGRFHHRVDQNMTGRKPQRGRVRVWVYHPLEDTTVEEGLEEVET